MKRRILHGEIAIPHAAADVYDGVARHAAEAGLRFRRIDLFLDGPVEAAIEEDGVIVTSGAPFAGAGADDVLHVLDGLAIELIVEGGEVVHGTLPLLVDVLVAVAAELRVHEEVRRDDGSGIGLGGGWGKGRVGAAAFHVHGDGGHGRVLYAVVRIGPRTAVERAGRRQENEYGDGSHEGCSPGTRDGLTKETEADDDHGYDGQQDVRPKRPAVVHGVAADREEDGREAREEEGDARYGIAPQVEGGEGHQGEAESQVQEHVGHVEDTGMGEGGDIGAIDN